MESDNPSHAVILLEKGKVGVQKPSCFSEAVKKGVSIAGFSGKS